MLRPRFWFDTDDDSHTGGTDSTPEPADANDEQTTPAQKTPEKGTDWEAAYKGLQRVQSKTKKELDEMSTKYNQVLEEREQLKQTLKELEGEKAELQKTNVDLTTKVNSSKTQEEQFTLAQQRYNLILGEFPDLASFEANGLLPGDLTNQDEMRQKFTEFREALDKSGRQRVQDAVKGEGPGPVSDNQERKGKRSKDDIYAEMVSLAGTQEPKDRARYDEVMAEWIAAN